MMCRDVDVVKQVLTSKQSFVKDTNVWSNSSLNALFSGPRWTEVANLVQPFVGETLFTTDGESWKVQRSAINCLFSSKFVCQLEQKLSEFSFNIVDRWAKDIATSSQDVVVRDILPDVHDMTLDAIISVVVGCSRKELDEIKPRWGQRLFSTFRKSLSAFVQKYQEPVWKTTLVPYEYDSSVSSHMKDMVAIILETVEEKVNRELLGMDMISILLNVGMPVETVVHTAVNAIIAGAESNAAGVAFALRCMAENPSIMKRAIGEVDEVLGQASPNAEDLKKLTFVEQCYKEAMRMYAPATIVHRVAAKDTEVNGVFFPKGTAIGVCIHSMHFDEKHWENPTVYDPDRFSLDSSKKRPFYSYMPFSHGPRGCPGQRLSIFEAKTVLAILLQQFEVSTPDDHKKMNFLQKFVHWPQRGVPLQIKCRANLNCSAA